MMLRNIFVLSFISLSAYKYCDCFQGHKTKSINDQPEPIATHLDSAAFESNASIDPVSTTDTVRASVNDAVELSTATSGLQYISSYLFTADMNTLKESIRDLILEYKSRNFKSIYPQEKILSNQICVVNFYKDSTKIHLYAMLQMRNGRLQWVNINLEPVSTPLESHKSILDHVLKERRLSMEPEGRIGYGLEAKITNALQSNNSHECFVLPLENGPSESKDPDSEYTKFILGISKQEPHKLDVSNGILYNEYFWGKPLKAVLVWRDAQNHCHNMIVSLTPSYNNRGGTVTESDQFIWLGEALDLSQEWKCAVLHSDAFKELYPSGYVCNNTGKFILQNGRQWFSNITEPTALESINCHFSTHNGEKIIDWRKNNQII